MEHSKYLRCFDASFNFKRFRKFQTLSQFQKLLKVFIQTWQRIYWQNLRSRQIDTQLNLSLIITNFELVSITEGYMFNILKNFEVTKAAGIDKISGKYLKDRARILTKPISELCNLSITLRSFPDACKIEKVEPLFKKGSIQQIHQVTDQYFYCLCYLKSLKELFFIKQKNS